METVLLAVAFVAGSAAYWAASKYLGPAITKARAAIAAKVAPKAK